MLFQCVNRVVILGNKMYCAQALGFCSRSLPYFETSTKPAKIRLRVGRPPRFEVEFGRAEPNVKSAAAPPKSPTGHQQNGHLKSTQRITETGKGTQSSSS